MTKTNASAKTAIRAAKKMAMNTEAPEADLPTPKGKPITDAADIAQINPKGKKVLTATDFPGKTDAQIKAELEAELRKENATTGAPRANRGKPMLANGVTGQNAPHSAKAIHDATDKTKTANKTDKAIAKAKDRADAKAARAAKKAEKAAPKGDDNRKITIVDKKFTYGREGSARNLSWLACTKAKTVADYAKVGGALKYLPRWVAAGAIKLG